MSTIHTGPSNNSRGSEAWSHSWTHLNLDRVSRSYCRVTLDHPPINTMTATTVAELAELVGRDPLAPAGRPSQHQRRGRAGLPLPLREQHWR